MREYIVRNSSLVVLLTLYVANSPNVGAIEPRASGLNELVILDPGTHSRGLPAVVTRPGENGLTVDIPPTVHVHRFYYSGDKEFQGPVLQGGPTTVVANHPKTGERKYINVTLPPGVPIIAHSKCAITYVYPNRRIALNFSNWNTDKVHVKFHAGQGYARRLRDSRGKIAGAFRKEYQTSPTWQSLQKHLDESASMFGGITDRADEVTGDLLDRVFQLTDMIPGAAALKVTQMRNHRATTHRQSMRFARDSSGTHRVLCLQIDERHFGLIFRGHVTNKFVTI